MGAEIPSHNDQTPDGLDLLRQIREGVAAELNASQETANRLGTMEEAQRENMEALKPAQRQVAEVDEQLKALTLNGAALMLEDPDRRKEFTEFARIQLDRYHRYKETRDSFFSSLPQSPENQDAAKQINRVADEAYALYEQAYGKLTSVETANGKGEEAERARNGLWADLIRATRTLEQYMNAFDKMSGNHTSLAKAFLPEAEAYGTNNESRAESVRRMNEVNQKRRAFLESHQDATKDSPEQAELRKVLTEMFALYQQNYPDGKDTAPDSVAKALYAFAVMDEALTAYDVRMSVNETLGNLEDTAVAQVESATPSPSEPAATDIPRTTQADIPLAMPEATVSEPVVPLPDTTPPVIARREQTNETPDIASRSMAPIPRADLMEQVPVVTEPVTVPEEPQPEAIASNEPARQPERIRMEFSELGSLLPKKKVEAAPLDPDIIIPKTVAEAETKSVPTTVAEAAPAPKENVALSNGVIDVQGKEIYLAYYLVDGSRSVNFLKLGGSPNTTAINMPGRFSAVRTPNGWSVRPAAGLKGTFLLRADGVDNWVYLDQNAVVRGSEAVRPTTAAAATPETQMQSIRPGTTPQYFSRQPRFPRAQRFFGRFRRR